METRSTIDDPVLLERIADLSHGTPDPTGNWIGGGRPHTNLDIPVGPHGTSSKAFARWSAMHYAFYEELMRRDHLEERRMYPSVLDLGCAGGARTKQLWMAYHGHVLGIDRDATCIEDFALPLNGSEDVGFLRCDWPAKVGSYGRIFAVEFFEHFKPGDQETALRAAIEALEADGLLFMTMPNEDPQEPPHHGCLRGLNFDGLLARVGAIVAHRGTFDNEAPGDPTDIGWRPIGPRASHNVAVITRHR